MWLAVPVFSVIDFEGICVRLFFAAISYFLLLIKLSKNSKRVSLHAELLQELQGQQALQMCAEEGNNEPFDWAKSKSWQKMIA